MKTKSIMALVVTAALALPLAPTAVFAQSGPVASDAGVQLVADNHRGGPKRGWQKDKEKDKPNGAEVGAFLFGLTFAAIAAGLADQKMSRDEERRYEMWLDYCSDRYRSFNPATGKYRGRDGHWHMCR